MNGLNETRRERIAKLWAQRMDTRDIARRMCLHEADVYNFLGLARALAHADKRWKERRPVTLPPITKGDESA